MAFTSTLFLIFTLLAVIVYYAFPARKRWVVLLAASMVFYASFSIKAFFYIIPTSLWVYLAARIFDYIQKRCDEKLEGVQDRAQKKAIRNEWDKKKRKAFLISLILPLGTLVVLKYLDFICLNVSTLACCFGADFSFKSFNFFVPLGISFYTFSALGYLYDTYNGKYDSEKSYFKFLLFMTWFPSIVQGPINRNDQLRKELFEKEHEFNLTGMQFALQRILWGFLKKLVIADRADQVVTYIFGSYDTLPSIIILFGLLLYAIEIYADFAGGMDIALGVSELFGINLPENFKQPYFATSVSDFWRRWHITLGAWMKDYVFYPFSFSEGVTKMSSKLASKSKHLARVIPACIGNILIFILVGIWHGAQWHYIFWGLYQGGIIAVSTLIEPFYKKLIEIFRINVQCFAWKVFRIVRTFFVILIGYILDEISDMNQIKGMFIQLFNVTNYRLISNFSYQGFGKLTIAVVLLFTAVWFVISVMKEKGIDVRAKIASLALPVRWIIYLALILSVPFFQASDSIGFMYANF